jgi:hypothetical protein
MVENNEISTGPGRYGLGAPYRYGNAAFVAAPTVLNQRWGAAHDMTSTKTDVESELRNLGRPTTRAVCGQETGPADSPTVRHTLTPMPEVEFPRTYERLVDPPCTMRGSGVNRWEWLCQNPQENVLIPFEHQVTTQRAARDGVHSTLSRGVSAVPTEPLICGVSYVEPAVPVPRAQPRGAPATFSDAVPGAPQRPTEGMPPVSQERPRGLVPPTGKSNPLGPPRGPPMLAEGQRLERLRAESGVLMAPAPFTEFIAPHKPGRQ